ncbi:Acetoin dehydrogenase operon transcriptional activator AcoR [Pseudodesulfovibrio hydrargyri]|uniref:Acetoin dehydrogenase operon transcriptional activator AcoR n=1 Tax=Pseudodesulfovibrio hydrargyri TaxID=2125990 RepID=A0A1J5NBH5_9BACT|nr:Acetoin dehydrogenase operon transcriptional activator AcoR [Pseudodesulfovibrio hydrargyri]
MSSNNVLKLPAPTLESAWNQFVRTGSIQPGAVRSEILRSWQRCHEARVNPCGGNGRFARERRIVEQARRSHTELLAIAKPFMDRLYRFVAGSRLVVFLSDESGVILECIGDHEIKDNASKVNLVAGTDWREEAVGTNGIGTAIKLRGPIQISGMEHYCARLHSWTCSAAPIFNDCGEMIGVLQVSGPSSEVHLHTLGMVVAAVEAIRDQIRIRKKNLELNRLNGSLNKIFHIMSDGALITDGDGAISHVNRAGESLLGPGVEGKPIEQVLSGNPLIWKRLRHGEAYTDVEQIIDTPRGCVHCLVTGTTLRNDTGDPNGAVVFFNRINKVKKLVNRLSGAMASFGFSDIIGSSLKLREAIRAAKGAAAGTSNVLILGESGTGKELFAQAIHNHSPRRDGPFVALNCAALPRELIASELFGYTDGAFTGSKKGGRPGKFEMADGGTLFLDEIGDMPLDQQAILLRVLQDRTIIRIGGDHVIPVNVRFVCATNKDLLEEVQKGNFRMDLYYRLNVLPVKVPPLRERIGDLDGLFHHLLDKICARQGRHIEHVSEKMLQQLARHDWPGNVRELENVIEKMLNADHDATRLAFRHLPERISGRNMGPAVCSSPFYPSQERHFGRREKEMTDLLREKELILKLLSGHGGNVSKVAREMGLSRNTIYRKMRFYRISKEQVFQ